jgi:hypothetical protein
VFRGWPWGTKARLGLAFVVAHISKVDKNILVSSEVAGPDGRNPTDVLERLRCTIVAGLSMLSLRLDLAVSLR